MFLWTCSYKKRVHQSDAHIWNPEDFLFLIHVDWMKRSKEYVQSVRIRCVQEKSQNPVIDFEKGLMKEMKELKM